MKKIAREKNENGNGGNGAQHESSTGHDVELLAGLLKSCFESGQGPGSETLLREVIGTTAHELEMLAFAVGELGTSDIERSLIIIYNRLRAMLDLDTYVSDDDGRARMIARAVKAHAEHEEFERREALREKARQIDEQTVVPS